MTAILAYPKFASQEAVAITGQALQKLAELNKMTWVHGPLEDKFGDQGRGFSMLAAVLACKDPREPFWGIKLFPICAACIYGTVHRWYSAGSGIAAPCAVVYTLHIYLTYEISYVRSICRGRKSA